MNQRLSIFKMNNKRYIVEFTADDTRDYSVNIETALLEHFDENMSMSGCEDLHVREEKYFDAASLADSVKMLLDRYKNYEDICIDYQYVDYVPGKAKNEENVIKWCENNKKFFVQYIRGTIGYRKLNVIVSSNWFGEIVSQWKPGTTIVLEGDKIGSISSEPFVEDGCLCVKANFQNVIGTEGETGTYKCWDLISRMDTNYRYKVVKEAKQRKEAENYTFWDIVEKINWEWLCKQEGIRPYKKAHEILVNLGYDDHRIYEIGQTAKSFRGVLKNAIEEYSLKKYGHRHKFPHVSDDSFWDLTAHIVGLGENVYNDILAYPEKIKEYADTHNYTENFEYSFNERGENPNNKEYIGECIGEQCAVAGELANSSSKKNSKWVNVYLN